MLIFWPQPVKGSDLELILLTIPCVQSRRCLRALSWAPSCTGPSTNTQGHRDPTAMNTQFQGKFPHMEINIKVEVICLLKPGWDNEAELSLSSFTLSHWLFVSFWPVTFVAGASIYCPIHIQKDQAFSDEPSIFLRMTQVFCKACFSLSWSLNHTNFGGWHFL